MDDFERCTPSEFNAIWEKWNEMREADMRGEWERLRYAGMFALQPWSKKSLRPTDVMRFAWDEKNEKRRMKDEEPKTHDADEERARYEAAKKRYGIK